MVNYRYVDAENEALRTRLQNNKEAAKALKSLIGGGGYFNKEKVTAIYEITGRIINGDY